MNTKRKLEVMKRNEEANKRHEEEWKAKMEKLMNGDMQAVLVDVYDSGRASRVHVGHSLEAWYEVLGCQWVEMPRRWIGDKAFVIICDEEGTFRSDCKVSARNGNEVMMVGNLLVVADDENEPGEVRGLTDEEVKHVMQHVQPVMSMSGGRFEVWDVLRDVHYYR